jgi:porin
MATVKNGAPMPMRTFEAVIEVIYEAHVATGWLIEPFFQYVFRPSGGITIPTTRSA